MFLSFSDPILPSDTTGKCSLPHTQVITWAVRFPSWRSVVLRVLFLGGPHAHEKGPPCVYLGLFLITLKKGGRLLRESMLGCEYASHTHREATVAFGQQYTWPLKILRLKNKGLGLVHLVMATEEVWE